jgi:trk system potassium uptake protein TrkA
MNIIVVGSGRVGAELAYRLYQNGHKVTVIDQDASRFLNLDPDFRGRTLEGEALNEDVLHRAGIEKADALAAVTNFDSLNGVIGYVARTAFDVPNVVVRNYDPDRRSLVEAFGCQIVSSSSWGAQRIEELLYQPEGHTIFSAGNGEVEIYEFAIPEAWAGRTLGELLPEEGCVPAALTRAGQSMLPKPDTAIQESDLLLVSATLPGVESLRRRISHPKEA